MTDHHRVDRPAEAKPAIPTSGGIGAVPPDHAPRETNQPLTPALIAAQLEKARANEQELKPLDFSTGQTKPAGKLVTKSVSKNKTGPAAAIPKDAVADALAESLKSRGVEVPATPAIAPPNPALSGADPGDETDAVASSASPSARYPISPLSAPAPDPHPGPTGPDLSAAADPRPAPSVLVPRHDRSRRPDDGPYRPAESDTDSPSRGIPQPIADPGKQITGGFGSDQPQYFALDGSEIAAIVKRLLHTLHRQIDADLRFGMAICYPQVRVQVSIRLDGAVDTAGINDAAFSLTEAEIYEAARIIEDDQVTPPDAHRLEADLERPHKQVVSTGAGRQFADREVRR